MPRLVGVRRAQQLVLTNRELTVAEALAWGIVNDVVADHELGTCLGQLAPQMTSGATRALGAAERLMRKG